jgi:hypothetical protein
MINKLMSTSIIGVTLISETGSGLPSPSSKLLTART